MKRGVPKAEPTKPGRRRRGSRDTTHELRWEKRAETGEIDVNVRVRAGKTVAGEWERKRREEAVYGVRAHKGAGRSGIREGPLGQRRKENAEENAEGTPGTLRGGPRQQRGPLISGDEQRTPIIHPVDLDMIDIHSHIDPAAICKFPKKKTASVNVK